MKHIITKILDALGLVAFAGDLRNRCKYMLDLNAQSRNIKFRNQGAPDGLPIPPPQLVYLVTGQYDTEAFVHNGVLGAECIKRTLEKNGLDINAFESILDFGCGCGRVMRQWKTLTGPKLYDSDYNRRLIHWCQKSLISAEFKVNRLALRLDYESNKFDFIYAISVFTHLTEALQNFWITELTRILKPGGYLLITVHGTTHVHQLTPKEREQFGSGNLVTVKEKYSGTNRCGAYHPERYVRGRLCKKLIVVDFVPGGAKDANQDIFLLQRPMCDNQGI